MLRSFCNNYGTQGKQFYSGYTLRKPPDALTSKGLSASVMITDHAASQPFKRGASLSFFFNIPVKAYDYIYIPIFAEEKTILYSDPYTCLYMCATSVPSDPRLIRFRRVVYYFAMEIS